MRTYKLTLCSLIVACATSSAWAQMMAPSCNPQERQVLVGVDSTDPVCEGEPHWNARRPIPWQVFAQGEYVGPARTAHVPEYRLRVGDDLDFVYRLTRQQTTSPYRFEVGDKVRIESLTDPDINREQDIQPDGTITLLLLNQVHAARRTVDELRTYLEEEYKQYYKVPAITVTPLKVSTKLEDLRASVDSRYGTGGQGRSSRVTPEGTIQLPLIGNVPAQGLTLDELKREIDQRYAQEIEGIEITPVLIDRAPRYIYVLGEVPNPGRYELTGPTTAIQSIAMAGGWNVGANLREVVVFRRAEDWRLMATKLDLKGALYGKRPAPSDELWIRDADIVIVPKSPVLWADEFIELVFTRGIYGVVPFQGVNISVNRLSNF
ncbi:Polysaccharide biosynthesis/export protein [Bremerella volcania]|uniref:Polysaccharide biosynthesis/export protein n=1 Tax=Bremerella volcania TaxID=2527984 RepID=A0A518CBQ3_9BACT|nr:polysaccharide biosynthesis/export family protein [Bremerella volcania]QDU76656.1 Polysaccharide biosynthesis/export protein [Bremerella volcania]